MSRAADAPLAGRRIVTTRDEPGELDVLLAEAGAEVVHIPLIEIAEPDDGGAQLRAALADLTDVDWLIVTSRHGAARVAAAAKRDSSVRLAAVGSRTASTFAKLSGRAVDVVPSRQSAADLVAAMPDGAGSVALVAQADRADATLADGLSARGYAVRAVVAYRTVTRVPSPAEREAALGADAVAFASGSAAQAWHDAIGIAAPRRVLAIGPTTAGAACDLGIRVTGVAREHSVAGLVQAVIEAFTGDPAIGT